MANRHGGFTIGSCFVEKIVSLLKNDIHLRMTRSPSLCTACSLSWICHCKGKMFIKETKKLCENSVIHWPDDSCNLHYDVDVIWPKGLSNATFIQSRQHSLLSILNFTAPSWGKPITWVFTNIFTKVACYALSIFQWTLMRRWSLKRGYYSGHINGKALSSLF